MGALWRNGYTIRFDRSPASDAKLVRPIRACGLAGEQSNRIVSVHRDIHRNRTEIRRAYIHTDRHTYTYRKTDDVHLFDIKRLTNSKIQYRTMDIISIFCSCRHGLKPLMVPQYSGISANEFRTQHCRCREVLLGRALACLYYKDLTGNFP